MATLGVDRAAVHPAASIATLMGSYFGRCERWSQLETASGLRLPALRLPAWMICAIVAISLATGPWVGWWTYRGSGDVGSAFVAGVLVPFGNLIALSIIAGPFARHLPASCGTVRGLIDDVVSRNLGALTIQLGRQPTEDEVFVALRKLISEVLGVEPEKVTPDARFVEDLGLG